MIKKKILQILLNFTKISDLYLKEKNYKKIEPFQKFKLSLVMKTACLAFTIKYKNQTIKKSKQVIQTNETSIVLRQKKVITIFRRLQKKMSNPLLQQLENNILIIQNLYS